MSSCDIQFDKLYASVIFNLFDPGKSLLNRCLEFVISKQLPVAGLPQELIDLIKIYKCKLRIKDTIEKRHMLYVNCQNLTTPKLIKGHRKYKHHMWFLTLRIKELIGIQIEESVQKLIESVTTIASKFGTVSKLDCNEFNISNVKPGGIEDLSKEVNLLFSKNPEFSGFKASVCFRFKSPDERDLCVSFTR